MRYKPEWKAEPPVTEAIASEHGLSREEFADIVARLGRIPTYTELGIYSVMWSEHCSYKNSIAVVKTLPRSGGRLLVGAGEENAGLVDIGNGIAVAFKIESHNHPSAVEPYQGAATGVGGILRDIFSMGARPIAALNSLRFGSLKDKKVQGLFRNIVKGIADYGNSFGVPTVAGEVYFEDCYGTNPLVNAMAVGIVEHNGVATATATGVGNPVMIVGSHTGRDGIHGATFASEEISEKSEAKRPAVQVGDPFTEKLLMEATIEAIRTGFIVGVQDMGAAGITCSTTEMSAKGGKGMKIDLNAVPLRESGMSAYEIMLSESQERMLFVVQRGHEKEIVKIFDKWDLESRVIGEISDEDQVSINIGDREVASVPAEHLVLGGGAPVYHRETRSPAYLTEVRKFDPRTIDVPSDLRTLIVDMLRRPNIASKRFVFQQYDSMVQTNSLILDGGDAAVVRIKGLTQALAVKTDCNSKYVYLNPRRGGAIAVAESARNVACVGAQPIAITNCLNFGNPYDPEVYFQFKEAVSGIGDACRAFDTPVTGGNVSFYNESPDSAVYPTPVIGMLGLIKDKAVTARAAFQQTNDIILLLGTTFEEFGGSEYLVHLTGKVQGDAPRLDLKAEHDLHRGIVRAIEAGLIRSAHDLSEGGLAVALFESAMQSDSLGFRLDSNWNEQHMRLDAALFSESQSRILVSVDPAKSNAAMALLNQEFGIPVRIIGRVVEGNCGMIPGVGELNLKECREAYYNSIEQIMSE